MPPLERQTFLNKATAEGVDLRAAEQKKGVELMNRIAMLGILALILLELFARHRDEINEIVKVFP